MHQLTIFASELNKSPSILFTDRFSLQSYDHNVFQNLWAGVVFFFYEFSFKVSPSGGTFSNPEDVLSKKYRFPEDLKLEHCF